MSLEELRRKYLQGGLKKADVDPDPVVQFRIWFDAANASTPGNWYEPNAMTLATASNEGTVSCRVVLLKKYDANGFLFFTNYDSQKSRQLGENPHAALAFYWGHLERQVRIEGVVHRTDRSVSEDYFRSRPRRSQLGAVVSEQSSILNSREELESRFEALEKEWEGQSIPTPDNWGGFSLVPTLFEFWQGRDSRLHDRIRYVREADGWSIDRLAP